MKIKGISLQGENKPLPEIQAALVDTVPQGSQSGAGMKMGMTKADANFFDKLSGVSALILVEGPQLEQQVRIEVNP